MLTGGRRARRATAAAVAVLFVLGTGAATIQPTTPALTTSSSMMGKPTWFGAGRLQVAVPAVVAPPVAEAAPAPAPAAATLAPSPPPAMDEVVIAPPPAVFDAPPAPPPPPPLELQAPVRQVAGTGSAGGTWAVIIGINDYPGARSDLRSAVNDANDVDQALGELGVPAENRLVLRDGQATADRIRQSVDWLVSRAGPDATAVFFYGGHVRKLGVTTEALVAADGALIEDRELGERLSHMAARRGWIAIAACYGGGFTELLAPGRVLTGAAPADALAYESSEYGRSYMVQYMVREAMIEKRAAGSVQAAFLYAVTELARRHPGRQPIQIDAGPGPLDLRPIVAAPAVAAPPVPSTPSTPPTTACRQLLILACR